MTGGRIAMKVDTTSRFQDPVKLLKPGSHHDEIRHHVGWPEKNPKRLEEIGKPPSFLDRLKVCFFGFGSPFPRVFKGGDLGVRVLPALFLEQHVVGGIRVERRVEVYEIYRLVRGVLPHDRQVIAKKQL